MRNLKIKTFPTDIPESFSVDIAHLRPGVTISIGEVPLPEGVELLQDPALPVVNITAARGAVIAG